MSLRKKSISQINESQTPSVSDNSDIDMCEDVFEDVFDNKSSMKHTYKYRHKAREIVMLEHALSALHGIMQDESDNSIIFSREEELRHISSFVHNQLQQKSSGVLYICGAPGTGKTLCCTSVLEKLDTHMQKGVSNKTQTFKTAHMNAVSMCDGIKIFTHIASEIGMSAADIRQLSNLHKIGGTDAVVSNILEYQKRKRTMTVFLVDEVDQLPSVLHKTGSTLSALKAPVRSSRRSVCASAKSTQQEDILMSLFNLCLHPKSKMILLAIANAATLAHNVLSRLDVNGNFQNIIFEPYTCAQLREIVRGRICASLKCVCASEGEIAAMMDMGAIEFCIRKVAAFHGDCRQSLDACRRALSSKLVEARQAGVYVEHSDICAYESTHDGSNAHTPTDTYSQCSVGTPKKSQSSHTHTHTNTYTQIDLYTDTQAESPPENRFEKMRICEDESDKENTHAHTNINLQTCTPTHTTKTRRHSTYTRSIHANNTVSKVTLQDMQNVLNIQYRDEKAKNRDITSKLPQHCKLILCAACQIISKPNAPEKIDNCTLYKQYTDLCKRMSVPVPTGMSHLLDGLTGLESSGFISVQKPVSRTPLKRPGGARGRVGISGPSAPSNFVIVNLTHTEISDVLQHTSGIFGSVLS